MIKTSLSGAERMKKANEVRKQKIEERKKLIGKENIGVTQETEMTDEEEVLRRRLQELSSKKTSNAPLPATKKISKPTARPEIQETRKTPVTQQQISKNVKKDEQIQNEQDDDDDDDDDEEDDDETGISHAQMENAMIPEQSEKKVGKVGTTQPAFATKWNQFCKIVSLTYPTVIPQDSFIQNRKFEIKFKYRDEKGTCHGATVRFGSRDNHDYINNQDESLKKRNTKMYGSLTNPLDPRYWRYQLCNTEVDMNTAFCQYLIKNQF